MNSILDDILSMFLPCGNNIVVIRKSSMRRQIFKYLGNVVI